MWTLPAAGLEVVGAQRIGAVFVWSRANIALGCPLLTWVHNAVGLVEVLGATRTHVVIVTRIWVEAADVAVMRIDFWLAMGHPLGEHASGAGAFLNPDRCA